jgi:hypothetical protein
MDNAQNFDSCVKERLVVMFARGRIVAWLLGTCICSHRANVALVPRSVTFVLYQVEIKFIDFFRNESLYQKHHVPA